MVIHLQSPVRAQLGSFPIVFLPTEGWHCRNMRWLELMAIWTEIKIFYLKCLPSVVPQAKCIRVHHKSWGLACNFAEYQWISVWASEEGSVLLSPRTPLWCSYTFQLAHCRTVFLNFLYMNSLEINVEVKPLWPFGFFLSFFFLIAISNSKSAWESSQK